MLSNRSGWVGGACWIPRTSRRGGCCATVMLLGTCTHPLYSCYASQVWCCDASWHLHACAMLHNSFNSSSCFLGCSCHCSVWIFLEHAIFFTHPHVFLPVSFCRSCKAWFGSSRDVGMIWDVGCFVCIFLPNVYNVDKYVYPDVCGKVSVLYVFIHVYVYGCVDIFGDVSIPLCRVYLCWCLCLWDVFARQAPQCFLATLCKRVLKMSRWGTVRNLGGLGWGSKTAGWNIQQERMSSQLHVFTRDWNNDCCQQNRSNWVVPKMMFCKWRFHVLDIPKYQNRTGFQRKRFHEIRDD